MNTWAPIFSQLPESTLWEEPLPVRVLFLTMLSIKDPDHVVRMPFRRLCKKANLAADAEENARLVGDALKVLLLPDARSVEHQEFGGRRIEEVKGEGWLVLNGEKYRQEMSKVMSRLRKTEWQRENRAKKRDPKRAMPLPGETATLAAEARGDAVGAEAIAAGSLPQRRTQPEEPFCANPPSNCWPLAPMPGEPQKLLKPALGQGKSAEEVALGLEKLRAKVAEDRQARQEEEPF